jgi:hypothetical protein
MRERNDPLMLTVRVPGIEASVPGYRSRRRPRIVIQACDLGAILAPNRRQMWLFQIPVGYTGGVDAASLR